MNIVLGNHKTIRDTYEEEVTNLRTAEECEGSSQLQ